MKILQHGKAVEKVEPPARGKFSLGDFVQKSKGSKWRGRIVGFYETDLTLIGYAVESSFEPGSVQIYPEAALDPWDGIDAIAAERDRLASENARLAADLATACEALKYGEAWTEEYLQHCKDEDISDEVERVEFGLAKIRAVLAKIAATTP